ncbi:MAG: hypothetical protein M0Z35_19805 [Desulfitobacterium hafniense]|nr:hypothetical protein [Desulfitobacterium hafniense]
MNFNEKLTSFAQLFESDRISALSQESLKHDFNIANCKVSTHHGRKYTKVDCNGSGVYMVDNTTEEIFGIKAYGVPHKGQRFGTLDTICDYNWGEYRAYKTQPRTGVKIQSADEILKARNYQEPVRELEKPAKVFSSDRYQELLADLTAAGKAGKESASFVDDGGTCNLDGVFLHLPRFNEEKTLNAIHSAGLGGFKHTSSYFGTGFLISLNIGQARKREVAAETMYKFLSAKNYDVTQWQQCD